MDTAAQDFPGLLRADIAAVYRGGFPLLLEPKGLPALAELSETIGSDCASDTEAAEYTLHRAIAGAAPHLLAVVKADQVADISKGATALLGLSDDPNKTLTHRREVAGPHLGYPGGNEQLRKAQHRKSPVEDCILDALHAQLLYLSATFNFSFTGRHLTETTAFVVNQQPAPSDAPSSLEQAITGINLYIETAPSLTAKQARLLPLFSKIFFEDVIEVCACGFDVMSKSPYKIAPYISSLAYICVGGFMPFHLDSPSGTRFKWAAEHPSRVSARELEALLNWGIRQLENSREEEAAIELLGIGETRELGPKERLDRALTHLEFADMAEFLRDGQSVLRNLTEHLVRLAVCSEFETMFGENKRKKVESLPFAFLYAGREHRATE